MLAFFTLQPVMATHPVKLWRVLCCKFQLAYDNFIGGYFVIPHVSQDLCEVTVIQLLHSSRNKGTVDELVGSYSRPLKQQGWLSCQLAQDFQNDLRSSFLQCQPTLPMTFFLSPHTHRTEHPSCQQLLYSGIFREWELTTETSVGLFGSINASLAFPLSAVWTLSTGFVSYFYYLQIWE